MGDKRLCKWHYSHSQLKENRITAASEAAANVNYALIYPERVSSVMTGREDHVQCAACPQHRPFKPKYFYIRITELAKCLVSKLSYVHFQVSARLSYENKKLLGVRNWNSLLIITTFNVRFMITARWNLFSADPLPSGSLWNKRY